MPYLTAMRNLSAVRTLLLLFSALSIAAGAQNVQPEPSALTASEINIKPFADTSGKVLPFRQIKIIDARFDTSKLGFIPRSHTESKAYKKLTVKNGLQKTLEAFLNHHYQNSFTPSENKTLLIVVKTFWLHQIRLSEKTGNKFVRKQSSPEISEAVTKLEMYVEKDGAYAALHRVDTVFESALPLYKSVNDLLLRPFLFAINNKATENVEQRIAQRKKLSFRDISGYNAGRFTAPCLRTDSLRRGVYMSFGEFLNGQPTYRDFTLKEQQLTDELYVTQNGTETLLTDFWGFCDGRHYYVKLGFGIYPLYKQGHTFELWGSPHITHNFHQPHLTGIDAVSIIVFGIQTAAGRSKPQIPLRPMQLNMETGKVY